MGSEFVVTTHSNTVRIILLLALYKEGTVFIKIAVILFGKQLQAVKQQLQLPAILAKLERFDLLILDDIGYVKKTDNETSVLFELIAHRYERRSLLITANHPFSKWDSIFSDSMMTVVAVDRQVHHALIIEIKAESYRKQAAANRGKAK